MQKITPFLWFNDQAEEAAEFYVSVFNGRPAGSPGEASKVLNVSRYGEAGPGTPGTAMTASFLLEGLEFTALNGAPSSRSRRRPRSTSAASRRTRSTTSGRR
jgi:predicted 3-demethylubiquinone-9 3-methyltransferase (glyoxalase superfamily)